ncbi:hypothetical protein Tco_0657664 [Tanacetum coccineum]
MIWIRRIGHPGYGVSDLLGTAYQTYWVRRIGLLRYGVLAHWVRRIGSLGTVFCTSWVRRIELLGYGVLAESVLFLIFDQSIIYDLYTDVDMAYSSKSGNGFFDSSKVGYVVIDISRVYYVEGHGHNLFFVGQFCDLNLEVTFRQHACFIRNLKGVDLLTVSRGNNLYTLSLGDMMASSPICLLSKASKIKSWLWHRRTSVFCVCNGQKKEETPQTLADKAILSGVENRPPMLEKDMYDSWKSRMELYMMNRQHGRMILESIENGPLIWPTIEENGVTRPRKYSELSATDAIQADCDVKETNIILQGLPPEVYALVSNHRIAKELWERI